MEDDKFLLLKMHPCSEGIEEQELRIIAEQFELVRYQQGEVIHHPDNVLSDVYLVVQGRIKATMMDLHGRVSLERMYTRGDQFGGLGAALAEPVPIHVLSHGPSCSLKIDYAEVLKLTLAYPLFRSNMSRLVARGVSEMLFTERKRKKASVVAIYHESNASRELSTQLMKRLQRLGESPCLLSDQPRRSDMNGMRFRELSENGKALSYSEMREQIQQWTDTGRVILDLQANNPVLNTADVLLFCEQVFYCVQPDQWEAAANRLRSVEKLTPVWREKVGIVWFLSTDQPIAPVAPELKQLALEDYKVSFEAQDPLKSRVLANGLERLVHQLRGIRIGVALGGGAARGMAHLGVLKALEDEGIVIDMIAGTSAGAMTGTVLSWGMDYDYAVSSFVDDLTPSGLFQYLPRGEHWNLLYKYRRGHFDSMLRRYLGDSCLEQLPLPMRAITVDLITGAPVIRDSGDAVHAILESINLPGLSAPICRDGCLLVDGGLVNNVPANVLVDEGCNFVIAVSVTAKLEHRMGKNRPDTPTENMRAPSTIQTLLRSHIVQSLNMNSVGVRPADVVVEPDVTGFDLTSFSETESLAAIGEQATLEALPKIRKLLRNIDPKLFPLDVERKRLQPQKR